MKIANSVQEQRIGMKTKSFRDLIVWQKSFKLVEEIYKITRLFPREETYGLTQQIRRSAVSIPSNIAEGYGRQYNKEYKHFLSIAYGSLCECQTQYLLSVKLGYTKNHSEVNQLIHEVGAMLYRMINPKR